MKSLNYDFNMCHVRRGDETLSAGIKPVFSFEYEAVICDGVTNMYRHDNSDITMSDDQINEVMNYIDTVQADQVAQTNIDARMYLIETDWYVIRHMETGVPIPQEILDKRDAARASIVDPV